MPKKYVSINIPEVVLLFLQIVAKWLIQVPRGKAFGLILLEHFLSTQNRLQFRVTRILLFSVLLTNFTGTVLTLTVSANVSGSLEQIAFTFSGATTTQTQIATWTKFGYYIQSTINLGFDASLVRLTSLIAALIIFS